MRAHRQAAEERARLAEVHERELREAKEAATRQSKAEVKAAALEVKRLTAAIEGERREATAAAALDRVQGGQEHALDALEVSAPPPPLVQRGKRLVPPPVLEDLAQ